MLLTAVLGYGAFVAIVTGLARVGRPGWPRGSILLLANVPMPAILLLVGGFLTGQILLKMPPAGEIDASGMAMMVYMVGGATIALTMLAVGIPTSLLVVRALRRRS
ncbi:hypothetical protein [Sphingomonas montana]|uniref:hypothetical protein n=1 Tax=Sphingomonas montana TaxID=1843236 RepID=UPI0009701404|nr:hypothetical protein [Sphingomonas montana]